MSENRMLWLKRAWRETKDFFDWSPRQLVWPLIFFLSLIAQWRLGSSSADLWHDANNWRVSAGITLLFALGLFAWNLGCAPYRCERAIRMKGEAELKRLKTEAPIVKVSYDEQDCNHMASGGRISLTYGGRFQIVHLARAKITRVRCENPSPLEIRECTGYITLIEHLCEQKHCWVPVWRDALPVLWDHTDKTSTTIPPRAVRYLTILQMTGADMPIVGANPLPFGAARIFEKAGTYRLALEVCAEGKEGVSAKFVVGWRPPEEPLKWPDTGFYPSVRLQPELGDFI